MNIAGHTRFSLWILDMIARCHLQVPREHIQCTGNIVVSVTQTKISKQIWSLGKIWVSVSNYAKKRIREVWKLIALTQFICVKLLCVVQLKVILKSVHASSSDLLTSPSKSCSDLASWHSKHSRYLFTMERIRNHCQSFRLYQCSVKEGNITFSFSN